MSSHPTTSAFSERSPDAIISKGAESYNLYKPGNGPAPQYHFSNTSASESVHLSVTTSERGTVPIVLPPGTKIHPYWGRSGVFHFEDLEQIFTLLTIGPVDGAAERTVVDSTYLDYGEESFAKNLDFDTRYKLVITSMANETVEAFVGTRTQRLVRITDEGGIVIEDPEHVPSWCLTLHNSRDSAKNLRDYGFGGSKEIKPGETFILENERSSEFCARIRGRNSYHHTRYVLPGTKAYVLVSPDATQAKISQLAPSLTAPQVN